MHLCCRLLVQYLDPLMARGLYVGLRFRVYLQVAGAVLGSSDGRGEPSSGGPL